MLDPGSLPELRHEGLKILNEVIALVLQSMVFGIQLLLVPLGIHILLKQGSIRSNLYILLAVLMPFLLSSTYWALRFAETLSQVYVFVDPVKQGAESRVTYYMTLFNAIILVNYVISDCVVVWRAWEICRKDFGFLLFIPMFCLVLTTVSIASTIGLRVASFFTTAGPNAPPNVPIIKAIDYFQISNYIWSFLANFTSIFIISLKAWRCRKAIKAGLRDAPNNSTRALHILIYLIEPGFLYCVSCVAILAFSLIKIPSSATLGDLYMPMNVQLAGTYPTIVIVLVRLQRKTSWRPLQWSATTKGPTPLFTSHLTASGIDSMRITSISLDVVNRRDLDVKGTDEPLRSNSKPNMHDCMVEHTSDIVVEG